MTYVKIDDTLPGNPKVRSVSLAARWTYVSSICYSGLHKLNGDIQRNMLNGLDGNPKIAAELVEASLWEPRPFGWYVHDYLKHNRSKELIDKRSETYRLNALARANSSAISTANPEQIGEQVALSVSLYSADPDPPKVSEIRRERDRKANSTANSSEPWHALSQSEQETFHAWAAAIGVQFVFKPDSADMVLDMVQAVEETGADEIRQAIRDCRRDNVKPWPREVRSRLPGTHEGDDFEARKRRYLGGNLG